MKTASELYKLHKLTLIARSPRVRRSGYPPCAVVLCYSAEQRMYITRLEAITPQREFVAAGVTNEFAVGKARGADTRAFAKAVDDYIARGNNLGAFHAEIPAMQEVA